MIKSFGDRATEDIFNRLNSRAARSCCPEHLCSVAQRKLDQLNSVVTLASLRIPPGNQFEALKGDRLGQYSIRINAQYRLCFQWATEGPSQVSIIDYH